MFQYHNRIDHGWEVCKMKWFLIGYFIFSFGGDTGMNQGYTPSSREIRVEMPSKEICEQIKDLNKFANFDCWAKMDTK